MIIAPLLKLRQKLQNKRTSLVEDTEKPFLDHLEDLRKTLTRVVGTLLVSVLLCFFFNTLFFDMMKKPARDAGLFKSQELKLPASLLALEGDEQQPAWLKIHEAARGAKTLNGDERNIFLKYAAPDEFTRQYALALSLRHYGTLLIPEEGEADDSVQAKVDGYLKETVTRLPEADREAVSRYLAELKESKTPATLDTPQPVLQMESLAPAELFMLSMKLSLFAGIIVSFPLLLYFLLEFILPGLTQKERRVLWPALAVGFGLFLAGVCFAYFVVIPKALIYFSSLGAEYGVMNGWRIGIYISFVTTFSLIFGVAFELPVIVMVLVKLGLLGYETMSRTRSYAVIGIMVASAILTPTGDMFTMSLLAAPMIIMYEVCIWLAWFQLRKEKREEEEEAARDQARRATLFGVASVEAAPAHDPYHHNVYEADARHEEEHGHESPIEHEDQGSREDPPAPQGGEAAAPAMKSWQFGRDPRLGLALKREQQSGAHPHHPDPETSDANADYAQYLKDHAGMYEADTHAESIPVEDRMNPEPPAAPPAEDQPTPRRRD